MLNYQRVYHGISIFRHKYPLCLSQDPKADSAGTSAPALVEARFLSGLTLQSTKLKDTKEDSPSLDAEERQFVTYQDGSTYTGMIKDGKRHGHGVWQSKNCQYEGQWKADAQDGQGRQTWSDGRVYEGQFQNGRFSGTGKMVWHTQKGMLVYEGQYKDDLKHGQGKFVWPDGRTYDGEWSQGKRHGVVLSKRSRNIWAGVVFECLMFHGRMRRTVEFVCLHLLYLSVHRLLSLIRSMVINCGYPGSIQIYCVWISEVSDQHGSTSVAQRRNFSVHNTRSGNLHHSKG
ncbi:unnamed protein product [Cladocopium goreaui]|uniref:Phosphatidylinositol 4-phosphate 5-kinase 3 (AtPIP5K3) (1-phosphatidylinositol 4-phosphate kinase 3 ) (Diphosphoinositide kinase 3) (PtdIns(4)P-5-kinase 3) n=1 Tax=Cladocopium goreaui TaxID=2562237 RepID=A0A9P1BUW9_9DINO|nr:unnamed protein product [Cladocopium goreaui]